MQRSQARTEALSRIFPPSTADRQLDGSRRATASVCHGTTVWLKRAAARPAGIEIDTRWSQGFLHWWSARGVCRRTQAASTEERRTVLNERGGRYRGSFR